MKDWWIYQGPGDADARLSRLAAQEPPWRRFTGVPDPDYSRPGAESAAWQETRRRGEGYVPDQAEKEAVNTALYLRRPLLITGKPGVGKSTLAHSIAADLGLGPVLHWPVTSRATLRDGLYHYDALGRLHDANLHSLGAQPAPAPEAARTAASLWARRATVQARTAAAVSGPSGIAPYLRLGPLGTALLPVKKPRVLLVDEIDKSDIDLPGDLLTVFEEGSFEIPELARVAKQHPRVRIGTDDDPEAGALVEGGRVRCKAFPIVLLTSNGERDFPAPFLRRCIRLHLEPPSKDKLVRIVRQRLGLTPDDDTAYADLVADFITRRQDGDLATDQLLNAVQLRLSGAWTDPGDRNRFLDTVLQRLNGPTAPGG
ncbi:MoxR family ATPase [Streptomyces griseoviridis]|uniref:ATPase AAA n=1 Tax=Streptomyces griseoviridis TaxID=45398 RepID=A0A918GCG2_STRGD|nr:MoxR family ATPase [Streptomyces niveoruber]GGS29501.1 ATPase AAA [Streptomyces niveoruber]